MATNDCCGQRGPQKTLDFGDKTRRRESFLWGEKGFSQAVDFQNNRFHEVHIQGKQQHGHAHQILKHQEDHCHQVVEQGYLSVLGAFTTNHTLR